MTTLAHISDLHFGAESPEVVEGLVEDLASIEPSLLVVSGDLTQRARRKEFAAARLFLDRIPSLRLVVPGNHDIPLFDLVRRFASPLARFRRYIDPDVDPFFSTDTVAVLGMNTARSNTWKDGRVSGTGMSIGIQRERNQTQQKIDCESLSHRLVKDAVAVDSGKAFQSVNYFYPIKT